MSHLQALAERVPTDATFEPMRDADVEQSIAARFAAQVRRHGDRVAVRTRQTTWTYRELDARAAAIAGELARRLGVGQDHVALLFEHDALMVAGVIGALQAGRPYVPLDASYPTERLAFMLHDAGCRVLVTNAGNRALAEQLAQGRVPVLLAEELIERGARAEVDVDPMSPAYLLYTSGSTGRPKAVVQLNRNVLRGALPAPERTRPRLASAYVAPGSRHEQVIAEIWREVLGLDECGIDDNFFDLGGSSMRLLAVNQRVRAP